MVFVRVISEVVECVDFLGLLTAGVSGPYTEVSDLQSHQIRSGRFYLNFLKL